MGKVTVALLRPRMVRGPMEEAFLLSKVDGSGGRVLVDKLNCIGAYQECEGG